MEEVVVFLTNAQDRHFFGDDMSWTNHNGYLSIINDRTVLAEFTPAMWRYVELKQDVQTYST